MNVFIHRRRLGFYYPGGGMGPSPEALNETKDFFWGMTYLMEADRVVPISI